MKLSLIINSIINLIVGILIICLRDVILDYLSFFIAGALILEAIEEGIFIFIKKDVLKNTNAIIVPLVNLIIATIMIVERLIVPNEEETIIFVCMLWGAISVYKACHNFSEALEDRKNIKVLLMYVIKGLIDIAFAILLLLDPISHVEFHIIILGIDFIFMAVELLIHLIHFEKKIHFRMQRKLKTDLNKIKDYIEKHPDKEEDIIEYIRRK